MSLVNDMLNDLEQRRQQQPPAQRSLEWLTAGTRESTPQRRWLWWCLPLAVLFVGLAGYSYWLADNSDIPPVALSGQARTANADSLRTAPADNTLPQIVAVKQQSQPDRLVLTLSQAVPVAVREISDGGGRRLALVFPQLANELPAQAQQLVAPLSPLSLSVAEHEAVVDVALPAGFNYQLREVLTAQADQPLVLVVTFKPLQTATAAKPSAPLQPDTVASANPAAANQAIETSVAPAPAREQAVIKKPRPLTAQQRDKRAVAEAKNALSLGQLAAAEHLLRKTIGELQAQGQQAPLSVAFLAAKLMQQQRLVEAESLLLPVAKEPNLTSLLARVKLLQGQAGAALAILQQQQPAFNTHQDYYMLMALVAQQAGEPVLSQQLYQQLLQRDGSQGDWWAGLAIAKEQQGFAAEARQDYYNALQAHSTSDALRQYAKQRYHALAGVKNSQESVNGG